MKFKRNQYPIINNQIQRLKQKCDAEFTIKDDPPFLQDYLVNWALIDPEETLILQGDELENIIDDFKLELEKSDQALINTATDLSFKIKNQQLNVNDVRSDLQNTIQILKRELKLKFEKQKANQFIDWSYEFDN